MYSQDEATSAIRELREETGFEGMVTHVSPIVYSDPGLSNASMRYVFMKIDGDLGSNQQPVAIPDDGEIITVHRVPVKRYVLLLTSFPPSPPTLARATRQCDMCL